MDISEWENTFVKTAKEYAKKVSTENGDVTVEEQAELDSTVECFFKKLKLASDSKKCPFHRKKIPALLQSSYDKCKSMAEDDQDETAEEFEHPNSGVNEAILKANFCKIHTLTSNI